MYYFGFKGGTKKLPSDIGGNTSAIKFFLFVIEGYQELIHTKAKQINIIKEESSLVFPPIIKFITSEYRSLQKIPVYSSPSKLLKVFYSETINGKSVFYIPIYIELSSLDDPKAHYIEITPLDIDARNFSNYKFWGIGKIKDYEDVLSKLPPDSISYKILKDYKKPPTNLLEEMIVIEGMSSIADKFTKKMSNISDDFANLEVDRTKTLIRL